MKSTSYIKVQPSSSLGGRSWECTEQTPTLKIQSNQPVAVQSSKESDISFFVGRLRIFGQRDLT